MAISKLVDPVIGSEVNEMDDAVVVVVVEVVVVVVEVVNVIVFVVCVFGVRSSVKRHLCRLASHDSADSDKRHRMSSM